MGVVVVVSNYLVQFPVQLMGLNEILTYGAFSYPVTFLITDLANRAYGKAVAKKVVYIGFVIGILLTLFVSTNFDKSGRLLHNIGILAAINSKTLLGRLYLWFKYELILGIIPISAVDIKFIM